MVCKRPNPLRLIIIKTLAIIKIGIAIAFLCCNSILPAQIPDEKEPVYRIGVIYGQADQSNFIFNSTDYLYETQYVKLQLGWIFKKTRNFDFELLLEPSIYRGTYQLLNLFFVTPEQENFMALREQFTQQRQGNEYALNVGVAIRYRVLDVLNIYFLGSVGPSYSEEGTERLAQGFAFSDVAALGISYEFTPKWVVDMRLAVRHNSNGGLRLPNSGLNSLGIEGGVSFLLFK